MRNPNFRFVGLWAKQFGGAGQQVGDITWAFANPDPSFYHNALVSETLSAAAYPDLLAVQGPLFGKVLPYPQNAALAGTVNLLQSCAWKGALYSGAATQILKRASMAAAFTAVPTLLPGGGSSQHHPITSSPLGTYLLISSSYSSGIGLTVATSDTVKSPIVLMPSAGNPFNVVHTAVESTGANTILALIAGAGPIYRTPDKGATWIQVGGPLSTPADRVWLTGWVDGPNVYLIGAQGVLAYSTDDGQTWGVFTLPGAVPLYQPQLSTGAYTTACFDKRPGVRKGYALTVGGGLMSWPLFNPGVGFTREAADGALALGGNTARMVSTRAGLVAMTMNGIFLAGYGALSQFQMIASKAVLIAPPTYVLNVTDLVSNIIAIGLEAGNGELVFDNGANTFNGNVSFSMNDGVTTFDRYTVNDPPMSSGRKPFVRMT